MRKTPKHTLLDTLHKGAVLTCVGVTLVTASYCGYRAYIYFTKIKPERLKQIESMNKNLLEEGSSDRILLKDRAVEMKI